MCRKQERISALACFQTTSWTSVEPLQTLQHNTLHFRLYTLVRQEKTLDYLGHTPLPTLSWRSKNCILTIQGLGGVKSMVHIFACPAFAIFLYTQVVRQSSSTYIATGSPPDFRFCVASFLYQGVPLFGRWVLQMLGANAGCCAALVQASCTSWVRGLHLPILRPFVPFCAKRQTSCMVSTRASRLQDPAMTILDSSGQHTGKHAKSSKGQLLLVIPSGRQGCRTRLLISLCHLERPLRKKKVLNAKSPQVQSIQRCFQQKIVISYSSGIKAMSLV